MKTAARIKTIDFNNLGKSLKYSLYVITHPFDGFWDLTHEKRGSLAAANIIVLLLVLKRIFALEFTSFMFMTIHWKFINMFTEILGILAPIILWCISNWSLTTLMDGKGRLKDIYMGVAYAMTPSVIIGYAMIFVSNVITFDERVFYFYILSFADIWSYFLVVAAMMMIHDYSFGKAVFSSILTIVGMLVIVFVLVLFFSLISSGIGYFVSIYKELVFRLS